MRTAEWYSCAEPDQQQRWTRNLPTSPYSAVLVLNGQSPDAAICRVRQESRTTGRPACRGRGRRRRTTGEQENEYSRAPRMPDFPALSPAPGSTFAAGNRPPGAPTRTSGPLSGMVAYYRAILIVCTSGYNWKIGVDDALHRGLRLLHLPPETAPQVS